MGIGVGQDPWAKFYGLFGNRYGPPEPLAPPSIPTRNVQSVPINPQNGMPYNAQLGPAMMPPTSVEEIYRGMTNRLGQPFLPSTPALQPLQLPPREVAVETPAYQKPIGYQSGYVPAQTDYRLLPDVPPKRASTVPAVAAIASAAPTVVGQDVSPVANIDQRLPAILRSLMPGHGSTTNPRMYGGFDPNEIVRRSQGTPPMPPSPPKRSGGATVNGQPFTFADLLSWLKRPSVRQTNSPVLMAMNGKPSNFPNPDYQGGVVIDGAIYGSGGQSYGADPGQVTAGLKPGDRQYNPDTNSWGLKAK